MIVEFTGLPGSGKSTICRELETWLTSQGFEVINWIYYTGFMSKTRRIAHKLKVSAIFFLAHPILFRGTYRMVLASGQKSKGDMLSQLLNLIYVSALYRRYSNKKYKDVLVLFDQGKIQALVSLIYRSGVNNPQDFLADPLLGQYANDGVFQIDVTIEESLKRLEKRKGAQSRIERMNYDDRRSALESFGKAGEVVLQNKQLYGKIYRINSSGSSEEVLRNVKEFFSDFLNQSSESSSP